MAWHVSVYSYNPALAHITSRIKIPGYHLQFNNYRLQGSVLFIVSLSTECLSCRQHPTPRASRNSHRARGRDKRDAM